MNGKKARALRQLAGIKSPFVVKKPLKLESVLRRVMHPLKGWVTERIMLTAKYPAGHPRRVYQDSKKGVKGKPVPDTFWAEYDRNPACT